MSRTIVYEGIEVVVSDQANFVASDFDGEVFEFTSIISCRAGVYAGYGMTSLGYQLNDIYPDTYPVYTINNEEEA